VVQDVEEFSPETKPDLLGEAKLPLQPNIGLDVNRRSRSGQNETIPSNQSRPASLK